MPQEQLTKNDRRARAREFARVEREKRKRREAVTKVFVRAGVTATILVVLAAIGGGIWLANRPAAAGPANMASGGVLYIGENGATQVVETDGQPAETDPVPSDTSSYPATANIVSYLDFGCEYCKAFETTNASQIEQLVASGVATLEVVPVAITGPYAERSGSAVACLVNYQPESFFTMLSAMYDNQPAEGATLSNGDILDIWRNAGIEPSGDLVSCVNDESYIEWIQANTERVVTDPAIVNPSTGSFGTPTVFVNDVRYADTLTDPTVFAQFIDENARPK